MPQITFRVRDAAGGEASRSVDVSVATPPPPPSGSPVELSFPRNPGAVGSALPEKAAAGLLDFTDLEYEGWGNNNGVNERMRWVTDPTGSGRVVAEIEVRGGDVADQFGGCRSELWRNPHDHKVGEQAWFAWAWHFPLDFPWPDGWLLLMQNHGESGSPPQALELRGTPRDELTYVSRLPNGQVTYFPIPGQNPAQKGVWHVFLQHVVFSNTGTGRYRAWHRAGVPPARPDFNAAPIFDRQNISTLFASGQGFAKMGLYREGIGSQVLKAHLWGYGRAATADRALQLAGI